MARSDEQRVGTEEGAGWPPVGRAAQSIWFSSKIAPLVSFLSKFVLRSAEPMSKLLRQTRLSWRATPWLN